MAQTGFTPIVIYNSATPAAVPAPADLQQGELALNVTDLKIYTENGGGSVVQVGSGPSAVDTLTNKTIDLGDNTLTGTTAEFNTALSDGDFATLAGAETLSNKTLTAPILGTPTSGNLSNCTADGTDNVGFLEVPQLNKVSAYTLVLADSGKHVHKAGTTAFTATIPSNASVAFPIGTAITFVNSAASGVLTIAITTDTMRLAGAGTTGSRSLAAYGVATAIKVASTLWMISGTNLT